MKALPKPQHRSPLRMAFGKAWFITKRRVQWYLPGKLYATTRSSANLQYEHARHRTPLLRQLKGVDMWMQHNKVDSLKVAASCIDGIVLKPGETFSFWRLVGKPSARRGFKSGMVLRNGTEAQGMGGGLCQMTNLIYCTRNSRSPNVGAMALMFFPMKGARNLLPLAPPASTITLTSKSPIIQRISISCVFVLKVAICKGNGWQMWLPATPTK